MSKKPTFIICTFLLLGFFSCVKPFAPATTATNNNYLVVEGLINLTDSTYINLSRTVTLTTANAVKPELKAVVTIESSAGTTYTLQELGKGLYATPSQNLSAANQYRLRIKTTSGATYLSDFVASVPSPPIDTITWQAGSNLNLYVSTHDPKNATHYYRWDYSEEWQITSDYVSFFYSDGLNIKRRTPAQQVYSCYAGDTSHVINVGTSEKLAQDVINQQLINTVVPSAEKLGIKYSIQIKQYGLTKDAYNYWTLLKKNTEQLGGIFDSQPSASIGNIHNVNNATEPVLGFISAGTVTSKRIFIIKGQLPANYLTVSGIPPAAPASPCVSHNVDFAEFSSTKGANAAPPDTIEYPQYEYIDFKRPQFLGNKTLLTPIDSVNDGKVPSTYSAAQAFCVDCTLRGSSHTPIYWK